MNKLIKSREIYWCNDDDRHVLVIKYDGVVVGLNYCQGDDLEYFEENFNYIDEDLTKFYNSISPYLSDGDEIDRINQAIWAHFEYKNGL
jgi:transcription termination factor NusB